MIICHWKAWIHESRSPSLGSGRDVNGLRLSKPVQIDFGAEIIWVLCYCNYLPGSALFLNFLPAWCVTLGAWMFVIGSIFCSSAAFIQMLIFMYLNIKVWRRSFPRTLLMSPLCLRQPFKIFKMHVRNNGNVFRAGPRAISPYGPRYRILHVVHRRGRIVAERQRSLPNWRLRGPPLCDSCHDICYWERLFRIGRGQQSNSLNLPPTCRPEPSDGD